MYLAENLKFLREQNGKTQGELAVLFGIEQKTISSWECGSRKPPIGTIVSLAKLYRVSLDDLVLTDMRPPIPVYALTIAYTIMIRRLVNGPNLESQSFTTYRLRMADSSECTRADAFFSRMEHCHSQAQGRSIGSLVCQSTREYIKPCRKLLHRMEMELNCLIGRYRQFTR